MTKRIDESGAEGIRAALDAISQVNETGENEFDYGFDPDAVDDGDDEQIDRWHTAWFAGYKGQAYEPSDENERNGFIAGQQARQQQVAEPERPEGYYHMPLGTFEGEDMSEEEEAALREQSEYDYRQNMTSRKGSVYTGQTSRAGTAGVPIRNAGKWSDNALVVDETTKSFKDYLGEAEANNSAETDEE